MSEHQVKELANAHIHLLAFDKSLAKSVDDFTSFDSILGGILSTKYDILANPLLKPLFQVQAPTENVEDSSSTYTELLTTCVKDVVALIKAEDAKQYSNLLCGAVALLHLFVQSNFTGPSLSIDVYKTTVKGINDDSENKDDQKAFDKHCIQLLSIDGEPAYTLISNPHLMILANTILTTIVNSSDLDTAQLKPFASFWLGRSLIIWQSLLDNLSVSLYKQFFTVFTEKNYATILKLAEQYSTDSMHNYLPVLYHLELARAELIYNLDSKADESLKLAQHKSEFQYVLAGMKAKRTKFQQFETSQFVFLAKSKYDKKLPKSNSKEGSKLESSTLSESNSEAQSSTPIEPGSDLTLEKVDNSEEKLNADHLEDVDADTSKAQPPTAVKLNSDLLLEKVKYSDKKASDENSEQTEGNLPEALKKVDPNDQPPLQDVDSSLIMLRVAYIKSTSPFQDALTLDELRVMTNRVIETAENSVNWSIYSRALWERSLIDASSAKTVERGAIQMQLLVDELGVNSVAFLGRSPENSSIDATPSRLSYIHQLLPLPKWDMDAKLADRYMSLGSLKSALDIYERLQMWHQVALCYSAVGQDEQAVEVLKKYLESNPKDARAWSILGDVTQKPEYWEKSWEIGKYAGSRRSLAGYYYNPPKSGNVERNLDLVIEYLHDALSVAPLHFMAWFLYGCAGLETEQYELSAEAFTRCAAIDEQDSKSWSNLATSLLRLGKKNEAYTALKRAVALSSEDKNWRIWENYVTIAMELEDWNQVLRGTRELLKIRGSEAEAGIDLPVLEKLALILVATEYPKLDEEEEGTQKRLTFYQRSCLELFLKEIPPMITNEPRLWKLVAKVELWSKKPWAALESYEKGFRIYTHMPEIESNESVWNSAVDFCGDLVDAYINLGPMEGKYGEGSQVCSNWKFKAKSTVRVLMGKGKNWWEDTPGWERLLEIKETANEA